MTEVRQRYNLVFSMMFLSKQRSLGFTLIEFQLYLFLLVTMLALLSGIGISVLESRSKAQTLDDMNYNAQILFEKIKTTVARAESVTGPAVGETNTSLSLEMSDPNKNPTVFEIIDGRVRVTEGLGEPVTLSTESIVVTTLLFTNTTVPASSGGVRIELGVSGYAREIERAPDVEYSFYTSVNIKN